MSPLPKTVETLVLRTDFSNDDAWIALCTAIQTPNEVGFKAYVECISDPAYAGLTAEQLATLAAEDGDHTFAFLADQITFTDPEQSILVVNLSKESGRAFRVVPGEMWSVENNLSLANMDFCEFADAVDSDGVFRGFPKT